MHGMMAGMTGTAELALSPEEAASLSDGISQVGRHYNMALPAKTVDWTNLMMVVGMVYGPRLVALRNNRRANKTPIDIPNPLRAKAAPVKDEAVRPQTPPGIADIEIPGLPRFRRTTN